MQRTCIAIVDASRARILTLDRIVDATGVRDEMVEHEDLVNPSRRVPIGALFSEREGKGTSGPMSFGFDDHRRQHVEQLDVAFAREIMRRIATHTSDARVRTLVICASPHMLGELRHHETLVRRAHLEIHELASNYVELTPHQLQAQLAARGLVPELARR